jgi:hypothetical protein
VTAGSLEFTVLVSEYGTVNLCISRKVSIVDALKWSDDYCIVMEENEVER